MTVDLHSQISVISIDRLLNLIPVISVILDSAGLITDIKLKHIGGQTALSIKLNI